LKNRVRLSRRSSANANRKFEVDKGSPFILVLNETLPVVAVRVCNPDSFAYWSDVLRVEVKRFTASVLAMTT